VIKAMFTTMAAAAVTAGLAGTAAADRFASGEVCAERGVFLDKLGAAFGEVPVAAGLGTDGNVVEVLRAPDGGWTMIVTDPDGMTCVMAAGEAWQSRGIGAAAQPSEAS
jgi:hypothetical protein